MAYVSPHQDAFTAIAVPARRILLDAMLDTERSVKQLTQTLRISQPAVSQHLKVLRLAGLVDERRAGRNRFYRTRPEELGAVVDWLAKYRIFWSSRLDRFEARLEARLAAPDRQAPRNPPHA